jgi:hypothetical protein
MGFGICVIYRRMERMITNFTNDLTKNTEFDERFGSFAAVRYICLGEYDFRIRY